MKAILIVEMPKKCIDCPLVYKEDHFIYRCKVSEDQVNSNSIYSDCPLMPHKDYISKEWIEKWFSQFYGEQGLEWNRCKRFMLEDWEKENDR